MNVYFWMSMTILSFLFGCQQSTTERAPELERSNLLEDPQSFRWTNPPAEFKFQDGSLGITAESGTDFFNNPETLELTGTAPLLYREIEGDFVATALVQPDFGDMWNAASIMVYIDSLNWIKFAFENSDATGRTLVSVITRGVSDDANGPVMTDEDTIWLRIIKKGHLYALHWSLDGSNFKMARLCSMPESRQVRVGLEAQCPVGTKATHKFLYFSLENKTVDDPRLGV